MFVSGDPISSSSHPSSSSWGPGAWNQHSTRPGRGEYCSRGRVVRTNNRGRGGRNGQTRQVPPRFANAAAKNSRHEKKSGDFEEQVLNTASNEIYDDVFEQEAANDNKSSSTKDNQEMQSSSLRNSDDKKSPRFKTSDDMKSSSFIGSDEKKSSSFGDNDDMQLTSFRSGHEKKSSSFRGSDQKKSSRKSSNSVTPPIQPLMEIQTHNPNLTYGSSSSRSNSSSSSSPGSRSSSGSNYSSSSGLKSSSKRTSREFVVSRRSSKTFSSKSKEASDDWKSAKTGRRGPRKLESRSKPEKLGDEATKATEAAKAVEAAEAVEAGQIGEWVEVTSRSSYKKESRSKSTYRKESKSSPQDRLSPRESTQTFYEPDENGDIGDWTEEMRCKNPAQWISPEDLLPGWKERPVQKELVTWMGEAWQKTLKELEVGKLQWDPKVMYFSEE